jgi:hypothetical protein
MAKAKTEKRTETAESVRAPDPPVDGKEGLQRLADLTRAVIAVPKSEIVDPPKKPTR